VKQRPLLYLETSIFGFHFDTEPRNALRREAVGALMEQVRGGLIAAATSPVTLEEVARTPEPLRTRLLTLLGDVPVLAADRVEASGLLAPMSMTGQSLLHIWTMRGTSPTRRWAARTYS